MKKAIKKTEVIEVKGCAPIEVVKYLNDDGEYRVAGFTTRHIKLFDNQYDALEYLEENLYKFKDCECFFELVDMVYINIVSQLESEVTE